MPSVCRLQSNLLSSLPEWILDCGLELYNSVVWASLSPSDTLISQWQKPCSRKCFLALGLPYWWDTKLFPLCEVPKHLGCKYLSWDSCFQAWILSLSHTENWNQLSGPLLNNLTFKCVEVLIILPFIINAFVFGLRNLCLPHDHEDILLYFLLEKYIVLYIYKLYKENI